MTKSFIDMMASHRWSEADILNRTEAMIAAEFNAAQVEVINRIVTAAAAGMYQLTEAEQAEVMRYNAVCLEAREAGEASRADMALLAQALDFEDALRAKIAAVAAIERAQLEIAEAQRVLDSAEQATLDLVALRLPSEPEPAPEPAPVIEPEADEVAQ